MEDHQVVETIPSVFGRNRKRQQEFVQTEEQEPRRFRRTYADALPVDRIFKEQLIIPTTEKEEYYQMTQGVFNIPLITREDNKYAAANRLQSIEPSRTDWVDDNLMNRRKVQVAILSDKLVSHLGYMTFNSLTTTPSHWTMGGLTILAWNLRNPSDYEPIFPFENPLNDALDVCLDELSMNSLVRIQYPAGTIIEHTEDEQYLAAAYSYMAAYTLRLATKPAENYTNAFNSIVTTFNSFYHRPLPLGHLVASKTVAEWIHNVLADDLTFRNSLANFLYVHLELEAGKGLRRFLYEQHLCLTGMHIFSLVVRLVTQSNINAQDLFDNIGAHCWNLTLQEMIDVFEAYTADNIPENKKRQAWKYARIFSSEYFVALQTKRCSELVFIMAVMYTATNEQAQRAGNIFMIRHLTNISEGRQVELKRIADRLGVLLRFSPKYVSNPALWRP